MIPFTAKPANSWGVSLQKKNGNYLVEITTVDMEAMREAERRNENTSFLDLPEFNIFIETDGDYYGNTIEPKFPLKAVYYFLKGGVPFKASESEFKKALAQRKEKRIQGTYERQVLELERRRIAQETSRLFLDTWKPQPVLQENCAQKLKKRHWEQIKKYV